ncbi:hypothetical protein AB1Y20_022990 [Prymnesium parvum]|uniref:Myosin motor domain-containing protein n=1 Tax=Prymnesium parvum TaxID=97485 RepID=A0AB34JCT2_PRYPA
MAMLRGCDDAAALPHLDEQTLLGLISERYVATEPFGIYTSAGPVVVALNPYSDVAAALYTRAVISEYRQAAEEDASGSMRPHIYQVVSKAYHQLSRGKSQAVIINGESGAGKTESTKRLLEYLTVVASGGEEGERIARQLHASTPALEAFGNAATLRNGNSSRFGKFVRLHFSPSAELRFGSVQHFLLERSRVAKHIPGEQAYHAFYYLCLGSPPALREALSLTALGLPPTGGGAAAPRYLPSPEGGFAAHVRRFSEGFEETHAAMRALLQMAAAAEGGAADVEEAACEFWRIVAGVVHLGEVRFEGISAVDTSASGNAGAAVSSGSLRSLRLAAALWGCPEEALQFALTHRTIKSIKRPRTCAEASDSRDALAKAVYERLFERLVRAVNEALRTGGAGDGTAVGESQFIGLLDIFGSEVFPTNGFEQLLINYANDKLQWYFTQTAIRGLVELYAAELPWLDAVQLLSSEWDLTATLELLEGGPGVPICILSALNDGALFADAEASATARDRKLVEKLEAHFGKRAAYVRPMGDTWDEAKAAYVPARGYDRARDRERFKGCSFAIVHFGATVPYVAVDFVDKNFDRLDDDLEALVRGSRRSFTQRLFHAAANKHVSISYKFRDSMKSLLDTVHRCDGHFIRCIKPNERRLPFVLDAGTTLEQLRCCGVLEASRVSKAGYPDRLPLHHFYHRFSFAPLVGRHGSVRSMKLSLSSPAPSAKRQLRHPAAPPHADMRAAVARLARGAYGLAQLTEGEHPSKRHDFALGATMIFLNKGVLCAVEERHERQRAARGVVVRRLRGRAVLQAWWAAVDAVRDECVREKLRLEGEARRKADEAAAEAARAEAEAARRKQLEEAAAAAAAAAIAREAEAHREATARREAEHAAELAAARQAARQAVEAEKAEAAAAAAAERAEAAKAAEAALREAEAASEARVAACREEARRALEEALGLERAEASERTRRAASEARACAVAEVALGAEAGLAACQEAARVELAAALEAAEAKRARDLAAAAAAAAAALKEAAAAAEEERRGAVRRAEAAAAAAAEEARQQAADAVELSVARALRGARERAAEELAEAMRRAADDAADERRAAAAAAAAAVAEAEAAGAAALAAAREAAAAAREEAVAAAEAKAAAERLEAMRGAAAAHVAEMAAARAKWEAETAARLGAAEAEHGAVVEELEGRFEEMEHEWAHKVEALEARLWEMQAEMERLHAEHRGTVTQLELDCTFMEKEVRHERAQREVLEAEQRKHQFDSDAMMQGLAERLVETIREWRQMRNRSRKVTLNKIGSMLSAKGKKEKDMGQKGLGDALEAKGVLLRKRAQKVASAASMFGETGSGQVRPLLLEARVFFKAAANLERTFSPSLLSIQVLVDMGNFEQARAECQELLELDRSWREPGSPHKKVGHSTPPASSKEEEDDDEEDDGRCLKARLTPEQLHELRELEATAAAKMTACYADAWKQDSKEDSRAILAPAVQLKRIGPFQLAPVQLDRMAFAKAGNAPKYRVAFGSPSLQALRQPEFAAIGKEGSLSPWGQVPADDPELRAALGTPNEARYFAFAFPLPGVSKLNEEQVHRLLAGASSPAAELNAIVNGFFVYTNHMFQPISASAIVRDSEEVADAARMQFDGPYPLGSATRRKLDGENRFRVPTQHAWIDAGVTHFTWIEPGADLGDQAEGEEWRTGAFVFLYEETHLDCFFRVRSKAMRPLARELAKSNFASEKQLASDSI